MQTRTGLFLSLGQQLQVDLTFEPQAVRLQEVETQAAQDRVFSRAHTGTEALLSDSTIRQMPVINRDLYDLVTVVPQMSTWFALAPSGAGTRVNSIRIDGVSDQVPSSNFAAGQLYGGKVIPLDAVKEYQVLFSPFDVRQGSFAGASINVVTRSGTNELRGSVFGYGTNERLGPNVRSCATLSTTSSNSVLRWADRSFATVSSSSSHRSCNGGRSRRSART
jgi:hypothetical protein